MKSSLEKRLALLKARLGGEAVILDLDAALAAENAALDKLRLAAAEELRLRNEL